MNSSPFSLKTQFLPEDAGEDKIDLEIGDWCIYGIDPNDESVHAFKRYMSSPPPGQEDFAWANGKTPPVYGSFFCRPTMKGPDRNKLLVRKQGVIDSANDRRLEAPLCAGYCLFYESATRFPFTGETYHRAKLRLSLNLQRFIRHQPLKRGPSKPWSYHLARQITDPSVHGDEFSFDGQDNWLPMGDVWERFSKRNHLAKYLSLVTDRVDSEITRACKFVSGLDRVKADEPDTCQWDCEQQTYHLSTVETLWEFPSENPIGDVLEIGAKLMHLTKAGGTAKISQFDFMETGRVLNSPCFSIPIAAGVRLKLYAKTNKRIRFEIVQSGLRKHKSDLLKEAGISVESGIRSWEKIPVVLKALRERAAKHMNRLMDELRKSKGTKGPSYSVAKILAEVAASVPPTIFKEERLAQIQTLLIWLCYYKGYRGTLKRGPYAKALATLAGRGVLKFDRSRQFYVLADSYAKAADALAHGTGEPLLNIFGTDQYMLTPDKKWVIRIRE